MAHALQVRYANLCVTLVEDLKSYCFFQVLHPHAAGSACKHCMVSMLQVREAVCTDDYAAFFRLYAAAPGMGRALLDMFVGVVRWRALNLLVRAFKPSLGVDFVARLLGFVARRDSGSGDNGDATEAHGDAAALEVLPGCSAAVFPGKHKAAVSACNWEWGQAAACRLQIQHVLGRSSTAAIWSISVQRAACTAVAVNL